jgi:hypothetical protein
MSQGGANNSAGSGGPPIETLTGNSGGAVPPDGAFNIDIVGNNSVGIDVVGTPASNLLTIIGLQATTTQIGVAETATAVETGTLTDATKIVTPDSLEPILATGFVVAPGGAYTTIQAAVDAANTAGGGIVVVRPGSYTEDLTLYDQVHIMGLTLADAGGGVQITGQHTPPTTGGFVFRNCELISATNIFNSAAAGSAHLVLIDCAVVVTNGYTFNVPNWTGILESFDVNDGGGTNDGYVNNTGGAAVGFFSGSYGAGTGNTMTISGFMFSSAAGYSAPIDFVTGANFAIDNSFFDAALTFSNNSTGEIANSRISSGATAAITMNSSAAVVLDKCSIDTSAATAVVGTGAGALTLGNVTFLDSFTVADTVVLSTDDVTKLSRQVLGPRGDLDHTVNGATVNADLEVHSEDTQDLGGITLHRHTNTALYGGHILNLRSNGTHATPTIVTDGDYVSRYVSAGYDGTDYALLAEISMEVDGTPGANDMPGRIVFRTSQDGGQTPTEALRINQNQSAQFAAGMIFQTTALDNTDSPYTILDTDYYLTCDVSSGVLTVDLPDAPPTGTVYIVKDSGGDAMTNNITVTTTGGVVNIDGATTYVMNTDYQSNSFLFNGTSWEIF